MKNFQVNRIIAMNAASLSRLLGMPITIQAGDITMKAIPSDESGDEVLKRAGISPDASGQMEPAELPMASDWKLGNMPGAVRVHIGDHPRQWIGTHEPGYKGETVQQVPFDTFEEG